MLISGTLQAHYAKSMSSTLDEPMVVSDGNEQTVATIAGAEKCYATVVPTQVGVRRFTPLECERLQGFPDGWTDSVKSDTARYKMLGNAVPVPVIEWIAKRLVEVDERVESGQC